MMTSDLADVCSPLLQGLHDLTRCSGVAVLIPQGHQATVAAQAGPQPLSPSIDLTSAERELVDRLIESRQAMRQTIALRDRLPLPAPATGPHWVGTPIVDGDRAHGCLSVVGQFQPGDERIILTLARQAAVALSWAERARAADRSAQQAQGLHALASRLQQAGDQTSTLDMLLDEAISRTGATHGCVLLCKFGRAAAIARRGYSREEVALLQQIVPSLDRGLIAQVLLTRAPARADDISIEPDVMPALASTRSQLVIPICAADQVFGLIDLQSPQPSAFRDVDGTWMRDLAELAGHALGQQHAHQVLLSNEAATVAPHDAALSARLAIVTDLAAGVAHEINNPLTTILGYTHLLLRDPTLPQPARVDISQIMVEGQRIAALVDRFLRFAQPTSVGKRPLPIADLIAEAIALLKNRLQENGIMVEVERPVESPMILGRVDLLEQAFVDLLENAIEAIGTSDQRRIAIQISEQSGWAKVAIADTGRGIRQDLLTRVFEPGFTTKVDRGIARGLGLGLYATHTIIQDHWGQIEVQSELWQGSTFTVCLPTISSAG